MPDRMSSEMPSTDSALLIASLMAVGNDNSDGQNTERSSRISSPFLLLSLSKGDTVSPCDLNFV